MVQMLGGYVHNLLHHWPHHSLVNEFGATRYIVINQALKTQRLMLNTVVLQEEVMTPRYVKDNGLFS